MKSIYIIGALKNRRIPLLANELQARGFDVFADWISPGPDADVFLRKYGKLRGWNYKQILQSYAAKHTFGFDKFHIDRCDIGVMVMPCGKSGHMELGYMARTKPAFVLFDKEPKRVDIMYQFATDLCFSNYELFKALKRL